MGTDREQFVQAVVEIPESRIPEFIESMLGWKRFPKAARDLAERFIADAMRGRRVKTGGARDPEHLAPQFLRPTLKTFLEHHRHEYFHSLLAQCWVAAHDDWRTALAPWAESTGYRVWDPSADHPEGFRHLAEDELASAVEHASGLPAELDQKTRRLVLSIMLIKRSATPTEPKPTDLPDRLAAWLKELEALPPSASEWASLEDFAERARQLRFQVERQAASAQAAAIAERRKGIAELIARVRGERVLDDIEKAQWFHIPDLLRWDAAGFGDDDLDAGHELLTKLAAAFDGLRGLIEAPGRSREDFQRRRANLDKAEEQITQLCEQLSALAPPPIDDPNEEESDRSDEHQMASASGKLAPISRVLQPPAPTAPPPVREGPAAPPEQADREVAPPNAQPVPSETLGEVATGSLPRPSRRAPALDSQGLEASSPLVPPSAPSTATTPGNETPSAEPGTPSTIAVEIPSLANASEAVAAAPSNLFAVNDLLLSFVAEADFTAAYWVSRALSAQALRPALTQEVLAGVAGAFLLPGEGAESLNAGLLELVTASPIDESSDEATRVLALAAAVRAAPAAPGAGMRVWLSQDDVHPRLRTLTEAIRRFADRGGRLPPPNARRAQGPQDLALRRKEASDAAREWLEKAPNFTTAYGQASRVWLHLVRGPVTELLDAAVANDVDGLEGLKARITEFSTEDGRRGLITQAEREMKCPAAIVGSPVRQLLRHTEGAFEKAAAWRDAVESESAHTGNGDRQVRVLDDLREALALERPALRSTLQELSERAPRAPEKVAYQVLLRATEWLAWRLGVAAQPPAVGGTAEQAASVIDPERHLKSVLAQRLKLIPELALPEDDGADWNSALAELPLRLAEQILKPRPLEAVIDSWMARGDFRFVDDLVGRLPGDDAKERIGARAVAEQAKQRELLRHAVVELEKAIEQAFVEGVIGAERAEFLDDARGIRAQVDTGDRLDLPRGRLVETTKKLEAARSEVVESLRSQWEPLQKTLLNRRIDLSAAGPRVEEALSRGDIRSSDEMLAHLRQVAEGGELNADLFVLPKSDRTLERYLETLRVYEREIGSARGREVINGLDRAHGPVPTGARADFKRAFDAWMRLDEAKNAAPRSASTLAEILAFVGFEVSGTVTFAEMVKAAAVCRVRLASRGLSPVPEFGSKLESLPTCEVVCVWSRKGANALHETLAALPETGHPRIVLYTGRLQGAERQKLRLETRKTAHSVLVLDEWLLCFLESYPSAERLSAFFSVALPWSRINPYVPRSVTMPQEMFFGRAEMARALGHGGGSYIVYGGRQLGKSALLEQVQRRFHDKQKGQFAVKLDIKAIGDPSALDRGTAVLFSRLRDELKHVGFLGPQVSSDAPQTILSNIQNALQEKTARLLVLLDEADNFLDADSQRGFQSVVLLRDAMLKSNGHLKIVLAGLHSVQRFQGQPNQPFAQLGAALLVGPLEPEAALRLIRRPFEALGFRFNDKEGPLQHILSFTNYHPGLLQLFCKRLLDQLQTRGDNISMPYTISEQDVEDVYRKRDVQEGIAERFQWTLALDPRYRVLVYSLILSQDAADVGHTKTLSVSEFLKEGQYWWRAAFDRLRADEVRGLLEEMVGLGVLVPAGPNRYRLRSPNVVRLLGSREDIEGNLAEMSGQAPPAAYLPDHHHEWLDERNPRELKVSPFTYSQERLVRGDASGLLLIFGSRATGMADVGAALEKMGGGPDGKQRTLYASCPPELEDATQFVAWLKKQQQRSPKSVDRLLIHVPLSEGAAERGDIVDATLAHLARRRGQSRGVGTQVEDFATRVIFSLQPTAGWRWQTQATKKRPELADVPVLPLRRWTKEGVRKLLNLVDIPHDEKTLERIANKTTSGWPDLLRALLKRPLHDGVASACDEFERALTADSPLGKTLWSALDVERIGPVTGVLRALRDYNVPFERADQLAALLAPGEVESLSPLLPAVVEFLERLDLLETTGAERRLTPGLDRIVPDASATT